MLLHEPVWIIIANWFFAVLGRKHLPKNDCNNNNINNINNINNNNNNNNRRSEKETEQKNKEKRNAATQRRQQWASWNAHDSHIIPTVFYHSAILNSQKITRNSSSNFGKSNACYHLRVCVWCLLSFHCLKYEFNCWHWRIGMREWRFQLASRAVLEPLPIQSVFHWPPPLPPSTRFL